MIDTLQLLKQLVFFSSKRLFLNLQSRSQSWLFNSKKRHCLALYLSCSVSKMLAPGLTLIVDRAMFA